TRPPPIPRSTETRRALPPSRPWQTWPLAPDRGRHGPPASLGSSPPPPGGPLGARRRRVARGRAPPARPSPTRAGPPEVTRGRPSSLPRERARERLDPLDRRAIREHSHLGVVRRHPAREQVVHTAEVLLVVVRAQAP